MQSGDVSVPSAMIVIMDRDLDVRVEAARGVAESLPSVIEEVDPLLAFTAHLEVDTV